MELLIYTIKKVNLFSLALLVLSLSACDLFTVESKHKVKKATKEITVNAEGDTVSKLFWKDGSLKSTITIKNGMRNGPSIRYYENGNIQFEINYKDGYKDGIVKYNYESGKIYRITTYKEGVKMGLQKYYYEKGALKAEVPYKQNEVIPGTKEYSKTGKPIKDYPKIIVKPIDKMAFENLYELKISLKPKRSKTAFSLRSKIGGEYYNFPLPGGTKSGMATQQYHVYPGQSVMEKLEILAAFKSKRGIPVVLMRTYNLAVENRSY